MMGVAEARSGTCPPPAQPSPLRVDFIRDEAGLLASRADWKRLWQQDATADLFGSLDWVHNLFVHFGQAEDEASLAFAGEGGLVAIPGGPWSLQVCVVRDQQEAATAILPLVKIEGSMFGLRRRILSVPLNFHAPRSGLIATRFDAPTAAALADALMRCADWDVLILDGLPAACGRADLLAEALAMRGAASARQWQWPSAFLRIQGSFEDYLGGGARQHFRRSLVKSTNGIARLGTIEFECHRGHEAAKTGFDLFLQVDAGSWKAKSGESIAQIPALAGYYRNLCELMAEGLGIEVWIMRVGGAPAAAFLCPNDGRIRYTLKSSFDESFTSSNRSPSLVLLAEIVRHAWQEGSRGVDFVGKVAFLDRWSNEDLILRQHLLFRRRSVWLRLRLARRVRAVFKGVLERLLASKRMRRLANLPLKPGSGSAD